MMLLSGKKALKELEKGNMDMKNSRCRVNVKFQMNVFLIRNTALFVLLPTVSIDKLLNLLRPAC